MKDKKKWGRESEERRRESESVERKAECMRMCLVVSWSLGCVELSCVSKKVRKRKEKKTETRVWEGERSDVYGVWYLCIVLCMDAEVSYFQTKCHIVMAMTPILSPLYSPPHPQSAWTYFPDQALPLAALPILPPPLACPKINRRPGFYY